jgi:hypothetical protein
MNVQQAKDFLVQQATEQAVLEGAPLSDLEKRMMYFTETDDCSADPVALDETFEAEYDIDEYETRMLGLFRNAYKRLKKEYPERVHRWNEAIRLLSEGDHYILVLTGEAGAEPPRPPYDTAKLLGTALLLVALLFVGMYVLSLISDHYGIHGGPYATSYRLMPAWMKYLLMGLLVAFYLFAVGFSMFSKLSKHGNRLIEAVERLFYDIPKNKPRT